MTGLKNITLIFFSSCIFFSIPALCQENTTQFPRISFSGIVRDASSFLPLPNTQIMVNNEFSSLSEGDGTFEFFVFRNDTILFSRLGYKSAVLLVSDSLNAKEYVAGIYMHPDTISAGEVVILPRLINLKSEILNAGSKTPPEFDNARYNLAVSAYQARVSQGTLGDPADNYAYLMHKQKIDAYEKGGIPSDKIAGIGALLMIPSAAIMIMKGLPGKPPPVKHRLTNQEVDRVHRKYLESIRK